MFFLSFILQLNWFKVLDKTLKGIRGVRLDNRKLLRAPGARTKFFECFSIVQ